LVAANNTPVVALAGRVHAASSWPCDLLLVSLYMNMNMEKWVVLQVTEDLFLLN